MCALELTEASPTVNWTSNNCFVVEIMCAIKFQIFYTKSEYEGVVKINAGVIEKDWTMLLVYSAQYVQLFVKFEASVSPEHFIM